MALRGACGRYSDGATSIERSPPTRYQHKHIPGVEKRPIGGLHEVERQARDMSREDRWRIRQEMAVPISKKLHAWMLTQRNLMPNGSATAKALDYSLKRWVALTRYLDDGAVPIDNNQVANQIRSWESVRSNWLFAGSLRRGKRAAAIMSLIQSARMNGHDPYAYLKDVLMRLPTQRASEITELLPHECAPAQPRKVCWANTTSYPTACD